MTNLLKRTITLLMGLALGLGTLSPGWSADLSDLQQQQQEVNGRIKGYQQYISTKNDQIQDLKRQIAAISQDISSAQQEINRLQNDLDQVEADLQRTEKELKKAEKEQAERVEVLCSRLCALYKNGQVSPLEVLVKSASFTDFLVRYDLLQKIAQQDVSLVKEIDQKRQEIEKQKAEIATQLERIAALKSESQRQKAMLVQRQDDKRKLVSRFQSEKQKAEKELAAEEQASRELAAKIRQLTAPVAKNPYVGGQFKWPVPGHYQISSPYGWRIHPVLGTQRFHDGIDIPTPQGTAVVAAASGEVIYAGWYGAYGNTVIISHGGNLTTLYAHLSNLSVGMGARVTGGQTIARSGNSGLSTGPHLHFGVRSGGEPVNPSSYIK